MWDEPFQRDPQNRFEKWFYWIFMALLGILFVCDLILDYQPRKVSAVFFLISWMVLVAIHELGHAIMAWVCGWSVKCIVVGFGRTIWTTNFWGVPMEWRTFPISGFVQTVPRDLSSPRYKDALIYAAGPGVEILLAGMLIMMIRWDTMFARTDHLGILTAQSFALAAMAGALLNLIPMTISSAGQQVPNDGMGIIRALRCKDSDYRELYEA